MTPRRGARARQAVQLGLACSSLFACKKHEAGSMSAQASVVGHASSLLADETRESAVIAVDGSSTVFPISEAVAEEFRGVSSARVTIGVSGTGGGFKKFCNSEIAIGGA